MDDQVSEGSTPHDFYDDPSTSGFEERAISNADMERLLSCLDYRERTIITLFYGLDESLGSYTLAEIGEVLGVHLSTVCKYKKIAIEKMREFAGKRGNQNG
jgi:RNA polymerase sigma factor (sigma-70 family)